MPRFSGFEQLANILPPDEMQEDDSKIEKEGTEDSEEGEEWLDELLEKFGEAEINPEDAEEAEKLPPLTKTEELALEWEAELEKAERKPGKGGTKPDTEASKRREAQKREEAIENSREKRREETIQALSTQLRNSPLLKLVKNEDPDAEVMVELYAEWVMKSILNDKEKGQTKPVIDEGDIEFKSFKAASGPGGQHMQKNETAIRATHLWSGISAEANSRSQAQNKKEAQNRLTQKLANNVDTWETYLGTVSLEDYKGDTIQQKREKAIKTKVFEIARNN